MPNDAPAADTSPSSFRAAMATQSAAPAAAPAAPTAPAAPPVRPPQPAVRPPTATAPAASNAAIADPNEGQPWPVPGAETAAVEQQLAAEGQLTPEQLAAQMQQPNLNGVADGGGALERLYHGVKGADILAAIEKGTLPTQLLEHVGDEYELEAPDGTKQRMRGTFKEWRDGQMRHARFTRLTMELAKQREEVNDIKQRALALFQDWDKPEGFAKGIEQHDLVDNVHAYVKRGWGTEQQPNAQGFMDSIHRMGGYAAFRAAAQAWAQQTNQLFEMFGGGQGDPNDPAVAHRDQLAWQRVAQYEADQIAAKQALFRGEASERRANAARSKLERDALLRVQQPQRGADPAAEQRITGHMRNALQQLGINGYDPQQPGFIADADARLRESMTRYYHLAKKGLAHFNSEEALIAAAAHATRDELLMLGLLPAAQASAQRAPVQQQQQQQHLPARPTSAPVAVPGVGKIPVEGDPAAFRERLNAFKALGNGARR